jgi:hypothetical protein
MKCPSCGGSATTLNGVIYTCSNCGLVYEPDSWKGSVNTTPWELLKGVLWIPLLFMVLYIMSLLVGR